MNEKKNTVYRLECGQCGKRFDVEIVEQKTKEVFCPICGQKKTIGWEYKIAKNGG